VVSSENAIQKWRQFLGNTKVLKTIYSEPNSIRGLYGLTDTRNACHGSDSEESVKNEIKKVVPDFDVDRWYLQNSGEIGAGCRVNLF
jgi:nucleoside-diphosphate kinase